MSTVGRPWGAGPTDRPGRSGRLGRLGAALVAAALPLVPAPSAGAAPGAAGAGATAHALPIAVAITAVAPVAPRPHTQVTVTVEVTNTGAEPVDRYDVELRLGYARLTGRSELEAAATSPTHFPSDVPAGARWDSTAPLLPGATTTVRLGFSTDAVQQQQPHPLLTEHGVYRLGVEVHDPAAGNGITGIENTFLPWLPAGGYDRPGGWSALRIAWLWPLVDQPRLGPGGVLGGAGLVGQLATGGRLDRLLSIAAAAGHRRGTVPLPVAPPAATTTAATAAAGSAGREHRRRRPAGPVLRLRPVPVTYAVDPALLDALARIGAATPGPDAAEAYLEALRREVAPANLLALPYADPDASALVRHGADEQLRNAENARDAVLAATRFPASVPGVAWPASGFLSPPALAATTAPYVVLAGAAAPLLAEPPYTPTGIAQLPRAGGPITALLADRVLTRLATTRVTAATAALVEQRFAAETALIAAEQPELARDVVIALPHRFDPAGTAVERLLDATGELPWLRGVPVSAVAHDGTDPSAARGPLRYPGPARRAELGSGYVAGITAAAASVRDLRALLCPAAGTGESATGRCRPDDLALPLERALLGCASSAWQADTTVGEQLLGATARRTDDYLGKVRITTAGTVTLVSQSGSIPITIANDLPLPVTVRLDITTPNRSQLRVDGRKLYVVPPGAKAQQTIQARTSSAGKARFPIYVQLETPAGDPVGDRTELVVRSSAYGIVAVAITGGALAVLFGTVAIRLGRTALRARRGAAGGAP